MSFRPTAENCEELLGRPPLPTPSYDAPESDWVRYRMRALYKMLCYLNGHHPPGAAKVVAKMKEEIPGSLRGRVHELEDYFRIKRKPGQTDNEYWQYFLSIILHPERDVIEKAVPVKTELIKRQEQNTGREVSASKRRKGFEEKTDGFSALLAEESFKQTMDELLPTTESKAPPSSWSISSTAAALAMPIVRPSSRIAAQQAPSRRVGAVSAGSSCGTYASTCGVATSSPPRASSAEKRVRWLDSEFQDLPPKQATFDNRERTRHKRHTFNNDTDLAEPAGAAQAKEEEKERESASVFSPMRFNGPSSFLPANQNQPTLATIVTEEHRLGLTAQPAYSNQIPTIDPTHLPPRMRAMVSLVIGRPITPHDRPNYHQINFAHVAFMNLVLFHPKADIDHLIRQNNAAIYMATEYRQLLTQASKMTQSGIKIANLQMFLARFIEVLNELGALLLEAKQAGISARKTAAMVFSPQAVACMKSLLRIYDLLIHYNDALFIFLGRRQKLPPQQWRAFEQEFDNINTKFGQDMKQAIDAYQSQGCVAANQLMPNFAKSFAAVYPFHLLFMNPDQSPSFFGILPSEQEQQIFQTNVEYHKQRQQQQQQQPQQPPRPAPPQIPVAVPSALPASVAPPPPATAPVLDTKELFLAAYHYAKKQRMAEHEAIRFASAQVAKYYDAQQK